MKKEKSIKLNFIMNAILTVSSVIFPLISFPYVSRVLQPEGIGKVNLAISVIAYFSIFANLGIPVYGVKACAKVRDNREELSRTVHELLFINIVMSLIAYAVLVPVIFISARLRAEKLLYLLTGTTILFSVVSMEWLFKGLEEYTYITVRSVIFKVLSVIALFIFVKSEADYVIYGFISVAASGASGLLNIFNARKYIDLKPVGGYKPKRHLKAVMILFAFACSATVYTNLDNVMLGFMKNDETVGIYTTAVKIKGILVSLITSLGAVVMPRASYYLEQKKIKEFWKLNKKAMHFTIITSVPVMAFFILFAEECIAFIAGSGFAESVSPMQIILPTVLFIGMSNIIGMEILVPSGDEKSVLISTTLGAVVDFIINIALIPSMGAVGAAIGTVAAEFVVVIYQMAVIRKDLKNLFDIREFWKMLAAVLVAVAAGIIVKRHGYTLIKTLCYSAVAFFGMYAVVMIFFNESLVMEYARLVSELKIFCSKNREKILYSSYALYTAGYILSCLHITATSTVLGYLSVALVLTGLLLAAFVMTLNIVDKKYGKKPCLVIILYAAALAGPVIVTKDKQIIFLFLLVVAFCFADYKKLMKTSAITHLVCLMVIVALALTGILENILEKGRIRYSLGFDWYNLASIVYFYALAAWVAWRNVKAHWIECLMLLGGAVFLFIETNTRGAFVLSVLGIAVIMFLKLFPKLSEYRKLYGMGIIAETLICPAFIITYTFFGEKSSLLYRKLNIILTNRLTLGKKAYLNYGVRLFGQKIEWIGGTVGDRLIGKEYNFVDSSFINILLTYGIIFLIFILFYILWIEITAIKKKDTFIIVALGLVIIHTTFDPQLLCMGYHPFLLAASYIISGYADKGKPGLEEQNLMEKDSGKQRTGNTIA